MPFLQFDHIPPVGYNIHANATRILSLKHARNPEKPPQMSAQIGCAKQIKEQRTFPLYNGELFGFIFKTAIMAFSCPHTLNGGKYEQTK